MRAKSETYDVDLPMANCGHDFGTMTVIHRETGEERQYAGVLRRQSHADLLKAAEWYWNNGTPL